MQGVIKKLPRPAGLSAVQETPGIRWHKENKKSCHGWSLGAQGELPLKE
jgi:hypothetical protein